MDLQDNERKYESSPVNFGVVRAHIGGFSLVGVLLRSLTNRVDLTIILCIIVEGVLSTIASCMILHQMLGYDI